MNVTKQVVSSNFGDITLYKVTNKSGAFVELSSLGAGINKIVVPNRDGELADVALGYADAASFMADGPCAGKTPGRYANRIALGKIHIDGKDYQLAINNGPNHLHGGPTGFQNRIWDSAVVDDKVVFTRLSPAGEENYPGNLNVKVVYGWDDDCNLTIEYEANTDAATFVNLTNHTYFNLDGHNAGSVLGHKLQLNCSRWLPTNDSLVPTGEMAAVENTPMDFRSLRQIGLYLGEQFATETFEFEALKFGKGYDNCFVVDNYQPGDVKEVAVLKADNSGRVLKVYTDQPAAQVYTGNWVSGCPEGKDGYEYRNYDAVAIECQGMPDAPNKPQFPSQLLNPGEVYTRYIKYAFSFE